MKNIIGRKQEITRLKRLLGSSEGELLAIYGRRRIGKTFLIREYFRDKGIFFELTGISKGSMKDQLRRFPLSLKESFDQNVETPKDWTDAFNLLRKAVEAIDEKKQIILFLDELPWLATPRSDLIRSLEYVWNRYFSQRGNLVMVLCGSAASWMIKKIINNRAGLYGRLTQTIHLQPFSLFETELFFQAKNIHLDRKQIVEIYMAVGGIAKYLSHIIPGESAAQNIQDLCFSSSGHLVTEYSRLFESLFANSERHQKIVEALATSHQGFTLSQIIQKTKIPSGGTLAKTLEELEASGFIQFIPFYGRKKQEGHYRLVDEYSLFYLNWIEPALFGKNKTITANHYANLQHRPSFISWAGYTFENICIKHITQVISALQLSVVAERVSYWSFKGNEDFSGAEIDLIIDRADRCMNLLEIKFSSSEFVMKNEYAEKLNRKREIFREYTKCKKALFNTLLTPYGAIKNPPFLSSIDKQIDLNALFY